MFGYVSPRWSLKYGIYRMPEFANGQPLVGSLRNARGEIRNPGFNADRGPARFWGLRVHLEY